MSVKFSFTRFTFTFLPFLLEVSKRLLKYGFLALPVVDNENRLVGIITVDDAINVIQDEVAEDFEKMAAMSPTEDGYFETSVFKHSKNRILWLLILMLSSAVSGGIITHYQEAFAAIPLLVAFIPMIMGTGGNCGSQASTLVIRGLAMDEIKLKDYFKVLFKERIVNVNVQNQDFGLSIKTSYFPATGKS